MVEEDKKKQKPVIFRRKIEEIVELANREIVLENININGADYTLHISNKNGRLCFDFNDSDYEIIIDEEGIRFHRLAYRHNHDHNDWESFQVKVNKEKPGPEKMWSARFPYQGEGYDFFYMPFGCVKVDY